jgi:hypothetical protein
MFADLLEKEKIMNLKFYKSVETNIDFHLNAFAGINCHFQREKNIPKIIATVSNFEKASDNPGRIMILRFIILLM